MDETTQSTTIPQRIDTPRLRLRPVYRADAADVFDYASNEAVLRYLPFPRHTTIEDSVIFTEYCESEWTKASSFPWAITFREVDRLIGVIHLRRDGEHGFFLGYVLKPEYWGRGVMTEATGAVMAAAFRSGSVDALRATCHPNNAASARVLQKAGFTLVAGTESGIALPQGGLDDGNARLLYEKRRKPGP